MPRIFVLSGPDVGANHDVSSGATFGRAAECTVPLHDNSVSRQHARLEEHDGDWHVVDTGSRNGLFVRGSRAQLSLVKDLLTNLERDQNERRMQAKEKLDASGGMAPAPKNPK